jgi:hypothetical protein
MQPTVFWRRRVYEEVGDLNTTLHYCMDVDFFAKASKKYKFSLIPDFLGKFRVHNESKTQNKKNYQELVLEFNQVMTQNFNLNSYDRLIMRLFQLRREIVRKMRIR